MSLRWRIYYDDGTTFDSSMGESAKAPSFGVICIVQPSDRTGRSILERWDWYYWHVEWQEWSGADIHGLLDQLLHNRPIHAVKLGRMLSTPKYEEVMRAARSDPDFSLRCSAGTEFIEKPQTPK